MTDQNEYIIQATWPDGTTYKSRQTATNIEQILPDMMLEEARITLTPVKDVLTQAQAALTKLEQVDIQALIAAIQED